MTLAKSAWGQEISSESRAATSIGAARSRQRHSASFRVNFKGDYGSTKLDYGFYPDSPVQSFNTLVLDSGINYWWNYVGGNVPTDQRYRAQCVRDQFTSDLMLALGHPSFHGRFYRVHQRHL